MKRLLFIFPILIAACGQTSTQDKNPSSADSTKTIVALSLQKSDTADMVKNPADSASFHYLKVFSDFALNYSPSEILNSRVAILPEPPDTVLNALRIIKSSHPEEFEKYLTLIFAKLYAAHLECCHQSYELRSQRAGVLDKEKDPLVYEFNSLIKKYPDNKPIEFIPSSIVYDYVKANSHLLEFEPIKKHIDTIEQVHANIEKGAYWK